MRFCGIIKGVFDESRANATPAKLTGYDGMLVAQRVAVYDFMAQKCCDVVNGRLKALGGDVVANGEACDWVMVSPLL